MNKMISKKIKDGINYFSTTIRFIKQTKILLTSIRIYQKI